MNVDEGVDVLIVGAGPVGLTLANDLAARGTSFRIIDELAEPTPNSRAHSLQSRTLEALDHLNLAQAMLDAAQKPQPPLLYLSGKKMIVRVDFASFLHRPYPYQLVIWQQRIERVLEAELQQRGHRVERATRLTTFETDDHGVTAHVERDRTGSEVIRAGWIVGCDGGHSTVRKTLGLKMEGTTLPEHLWLGELDIEWKRSRDTMYVWWHKDGLTSALFIDFTQKWHIMVECDKCKEKPTLERMRALFSEQTGEIDARLQNPAWMGTLTINQRMPGHFMMGRAFLAGDAAHVHSAAGGQGMNTGMQDVP
jgi:2-polyprenyl-6-methoxyphenol hydroxylase-like FAD-dependent oxidoreductase